MLIKQMNCIDFKRGHATTVLTTAATNPKSVVYTQSGISSMTNDGINKKTPTTIRQHCRHAFTLVEILVVVSIIAVLIGLLMPLVTSITYQSDSTVAVQTINTIRLALKDYQTTARHIIYPDQRPSTPATTPPSLEGFLRYDLSDPKTGLLNKLARSDSFTPGTESVDEDGLLLDPWGDPYQFVRGNFANKKLKTGTYDDTQPQDSNKPKYKTDKAIDSDWNIDDEGGYFYIYSFGNNQDDTEAWVYPKDLRENPYE